MANRSQARINRSLQWKSDERVYDDPIRAKGFDVHYSVTKNHIVLNPASNKKYISHFKDIIIFYVLLYMLFRLIFHHLRSLTNFEAG